MALVHKNMKVAVSVNDGGVVPSPSRSPRKSRASETSGKGIETTRNVRNPRCFSERQGRRCWPRAPSRWPSLRYRRPTPRCKARWRRTSKAWIEPLRRGTNSDCPARTIALHGAGKNQVGFEIVIKVERNNSLGLWGRTGSATREGKGCATGQSPQQQACPHFERKATSSNDRC